MIFVETKQPTPVAEDVRRRPGEGSGEKQKPPVAEDVRRRPGEGVSKSKSLLSARTSDDARRRHWRKGPVS
jgi:hypothetical protein